MPKLPKRFAVYLGLRFPGVYLSEAIAEFLRYYDPTERAVWSGDVRIRASGTVRYRGLRVDGLATMIEEEGKRLGYVFETERKGIFYGEEKED